MLNCILSQNHVLHFQYFNHSDKNIKEMRSANEHCSIVTSIRHSRPFHMKFMKQGQFVQSIASLMSSLRGQLLECFAT